MLHFETSYLNTKDSFIHVQRFKNDHIPYMYVHTTDSSLRHFLTPIWRYSYLVFDTLALALDAGQVNTVCGGTHH